VKKLVLILFTFIMASSLIFAGGQKAQKSSVGGKFQLALLLRNTEEQFLIDYSDNISKLAAQQKVDLVVMDARNRDETQFNQLRTLLDDGCKYFVIIPCVSELSERMNRLIQAKGGAAVYSNIPPTTISLRTGKNFFFASSLEIAGGRCQAQLIADFFDKNTARAPGKILNMILILGRLGEPAQVNREAGLMAGLRARGYTVRIVAKETANWTSRQSNQKMNTWIASFRDRFNVVVAQNDDMALGAVQALIQNGMVKNDSRDGTGLSVPVFGFDATANAIASMKRNELYATVLPDAVAQSSTAFDLVYQVATGIYKPGNTAAGISAATSPVDEAPVNDISILSQCYLLPFIPIDKNSNYYRTH